MRCRRCFRTRRIAGAEVRRAAGDEESSESPATEKESSPPEKPPPPPPNEEKLATDVSDAIEAEREYKEAAAAVGDEPRYEEEVEDEEDARPESAGDEADEASKSGEGPVSSQGHTVSASSSSGEKHHCLTLRSPPRSLATSM